MDDQQKLRIVMFPWLAFGHLLPYLELSKLIAQRGHRVYFISTPRNIDRLLELSPDLEALINFVKLPLPKVDNLLENAEATIDIPTDKVPYLKEAFDGLKEPLTRFLKKLGPDWVIHDFAPHWLAPVLDEDGVSRAFFACFCPSSLCFLGPTSIMMSGEDPRTELHQIAGPPPWVPFPSDLGLPPFQKKRILGSIQPNISGVSDIYRIGSVISACDLIAVRSCAELESEWLDLLGQLHHKPVLPIGLLPPSAPAIGEDDLWLPILGWLDKLERASVVYVALGSEVTPNEDELSNLALGLELSGLPFFWALRKRHDSVELPDGFEDRTKDRGVVWRTWAPQLRILAHGSVGGFLTHCGKSSVVEGVCFGRALIMFPLWGDQQFNAKAFQEMKAGIEIPRDEEEGCFSSESVAQALRLVMVEEEGRVYREKAKELSKFFGDEDLQKRYVSEFVEYLQNHRRNQRA